MRIVLLAILGAGAALAGCQKASTAPTVPPPSATTSPPAPAPAPGGFNPTQAQARLPTMKLFIGKEAITAEIAITREQVQTGMMFRKSMPENEGMLFVFAVPHRASFYMRNTTVPLTAAYLDSEGTVQELHELQPLNEASVEAASDNIQFVLEMNQGWFKRHNVSPGAVVAGQGGRLRDALRLRQP